MSYRSRLFLLALVLGCVAPLAVTVGQESAPPPAQSSGGPETEQENLIREQTIYIPYEKLKQVFEKEGRGVFLPYEKFQELWNAARAQAHPDLPPKRPVEALIYEIDSDATIGEQVVNVTARLQIEILGEGWVTVPLRLGTAAIQSAVIDGQPARIVLDPQSGYQLLHEKTGQAPQKIELVLQYARAFTKTPGQSSVSFDAPQAPINRWRIRVPEMGMSVQVEPMIAATRTPEGEGNEAAGAGDLLAFVGAAPAVTISWNPKAEGASGLEAFATVQVEQQVTISEGVTRSTVKLDYDISRATLSQLTIDVPTDQKVVNVFDRNVKRWDVNTETEGQQLIVADLFEATQGKQTLVIELERFNDATDAAYDVSAALVRAVGVGRQQGILVARLEEGLQGEAVKRSGLLQLDQNDLPESLRGVAWGFAYRYGAVPYELSLRVEKVLPRISVTELIDARLATDKLTLSWQGLFLIEEAGLFQLRVDIPDGFEVRSIQGQVIGDAPAAAVDSYHRIAPDQPTWLVNLSRKALGKVGLAVELERALNDPNLLSPTGTASAIPVPLPRATAADVEFAQGSLVLSAPESLRVNPSQTDGLRSISFAEAYQKIPAAPASDGQLQPALAYAFAKGDTNFAISAERRRPQVTVTQLLRAEIESGVVKYRVNLFYDVKYSGVKSLRVDVPTSLAAEIRNTSKMLRKDDISPPPDDVAEGYVAWSFAAETELLGASEILLDWEQKIDELGIGKSQEMALPRLIPMNVDRATGQIVISKSESIDIQPSGEPQGLIPIDPQNDTMPQARSDSAAMAFEFVDTWTLTIRATRYELETSKLTSIERGLVRIVALGQDKLSIQSIYRMSSARQRLAIQLPESASFDAQPLRIDGKAVTPERDSPTTIFAPLLDQEIDKTFVLELRYSVEGTPSQLNLPFFPDDPAVQKVYVCAYLPEKSALLASAGPWSDEEKSAGFPWPALTKVVNDRELLEWVTEGIPTALSSAQSFPIGKSQLYVYSALRPQEAPDGSLRLTTMDRKVLDGLVIIIIAVVGLPLFRRSIRLQLILLLLVTGTLLLMGVFLPELARTILSSVFLIATTVLVVIWLIGHVARMRWRPLRGRAQPTTPSAPEAASGDAAAAGDEAASAATPASSEAGAQDAPVEGESPPAAPSGSEDDSSQDEGGRRDA